MGGGSAMTGFLSMPKDVDLREESYRYQIDIIRRVGCDSRLNKEQRLLASLLQFSDLHLDARLGIGRNISDKNGGECFNESPIRKFYEEVKKIKAFLRNHSAGNWGYVIPTTDAEQPQQAVRRVAGRVMVKKRAGEVQSIQLPMGFGMSDTLAAFLIIDTLYYKWRAL
jgi:hypothetical protein